MMDCFYEEGTVYKAGVLSAGFTHIYHMNIYAFAMTRRQTVYDHKLVWHVKSSQMTLGKQP